LEDIKSSIDKIGNSIFDIVAGQGLLFFSVDFSEFEYDLIFNDTVHGAVSGHFSQFAT
jgi:hypothetical protein